MQKLIVTGLGIDWVMIADTALAQGLPVNTGSHVPVALWFVGSGVLGAAILYGIIRNRRRTQPEKRATEEATRVLYRAEDRDRRAS
jgi:hypothetical protein